MNVQNADFTFKWNLKDGYPEKNGLKVFSTFACGGGSTMGYKLAGYDVIGANDIDPQMAKVYKKNHSPKSFFLCPVKDLISKEDLPQELFDLDILDGSPPCSSFSMTGNREADWGRDKKFREGQAKQVLDDLFFDFINLVEKLKPKVVVAENVKGMLMGKAKGYCKLIKKQLNEIGYNVQLFLLNAASMGVPQKRERVFFICSRKDLNLPKLELNFKLEQIPFSQISDDEDRTCDLTPMYKNYWKQAGLGRQVGKFKTLKKIHPNHPSPTIVASNKHFHPTHCRTINKKELCLAGSYPLDYDFMEVSPHYLIGMSVPPLMTAQIAHQIYLQWFK